jgi:hypothetical protein
MTQMCITNMPESSTAIHNLILFIGLVSGNDALAESRRFTISEGCHVSSIQPEFTAESAIAGPSRRRILTGVGAMVGAGVVAVAAAPVARATETDNGAFYSFPPTRAWDTREEGGPVKSGKSRLVPLEGTSGLTIHFNLTIVNTKGVDGYLAVYDADYPRPSPYSSINWQGANKILANFCLVSLGDAGCYVYCGGPAGAQTDFVIDIVGLSVEGFSSTKTRSEFLRVIEGAQAR